MSDLLSQSTSASPRVRVIILNYNQPSLTLKCVNKVLAQAYSQLDVVVVDNASSADNYSELLGKLPAAVPLIPNKVNLGYAAGNNSGVFYTGDLKPPDFFLILNNDAFLEDPDTIGNLVSCLAADNMLAAVSPLIDNIGARPQPVESSLQVGRSADFLSCIVVKSWWLRRLPYFRGIYNKHVYADVRPYSRGRIYKCDSINGACFMITAKFLYSIGGFDAGTFLYFEETILGHQIKTAGYYCGLDTSVIVVHQQGITTGMRRANVPVKMFLTELNSQIYYCRKYLNVNPLGIFLLVLLRSFDYFSKSFLFFCGYRRKVKLSPPQAL